MTSTANAAPAVAADHAATGRPRPFGPTLALTAVIAYGALLALIALELLLVHSGIGPRYAGLVNQQNQNVKTELYLVAFLVVLPLALLAAPRLLDALLASPNRASLAALTSLLVALLALALIAVRLSRGLPWGDGVKGLLLAAAVWWVLAVAVVVRALRGRSWRMLELLQERLTITLGVTGLLVFGAVLCLTSSASLGALPLLVGIVAGGVVLLAYGRLRMPRAGRIAPVLDAAVIALVLLAVPDLIVFKNPTGIPAIYFDPGIVQFQHDYILGPTNQLLGGGALLVNDPVSQYGVGLIYFVAGWFHIAPIGYGTFGLLDGLLTAIFYACAYVVLRLAGVSRVLAAGAIGLGVVALVYHFAYYVGQLPEEGPLRFGLPMLVLLGAVVRVRLPRLAVVGHGVTLCAVGIAGLWALEAFGYTTVTFLAVVAAAGWLEPPAGRRRWILHQLGLGLAALVVAHALFALATLAGSGHLPAWSQYLAYVREFLFGGRAGSITYGFANWSPGLAVYAGALLSAAGVILLTRLRPATARANPARLVALAGTTAYAIALLSYTDNRSSTYLFLYVALPLLMAATLWLALLLAPETALSAAVRRAGLAAALAVSVLLLAGAWPTIGTHFRRTALAHFYPGGGFRAAVHRLWHPPAIDPRSAEGIRLLDAYAPARRVLILFPTVPDLGTEILIRSRRSNLLPIGDPKADGLVPTVWLPRVRAALSRVKPGQRLLIDATALRVVHDLRHAHVDLLTNPIDGGGVEVEWILRELDRRFTIQPLVRTSEGLIVATLRPRGNGKARRP